MAEFVEGFERLSSISPSVSLFGSAAPEDHPTYQLAVDIGRRLSNAGFSVVTGGGPGIMEAGNRGAYSGKSPSIGLNIEPRTSKSAIRFKMWRSTSDTLLAQSNVRETRVGLRRAAGWLRHLG